MASLPIRGGVEPELSFSHFVVVLSMQKYGAHSIMLITLYSVHMRVVKSLPRRLGASVSSSHVVAETGVTSVLMQYYVLQ